MIIENRYKTDLVEFFSKFYDKTFQNHLNNNSKYETKFNWMDKLEITYNNKNYSRNFLQSFCEINNKVFKQKLKDDIIDSLIYMDLNEKFVEMKKLNLSNKLNTKTCNKMIIEFYNSNKENMNFLLTQLIEYYENIEKNSRRLERFLRDKLIQDIKVLEIENKQKELFLDMIDKEDFINVLISLNTGNYSRD